MGGLGEGIEGKAHAKDYILSLLPVPYPYGSAVHSLMRTQQRIKHADLTGLYAVVHSAHQVAGLSVLHAILGSGAFNGGYLGSADGEAIILAIIECKVYLYLGGVLNNRLFADVKGQRPDFLI